MFSHLSSVCFSLSLFYFRSCSNTLLNLHRRRFGLSASTLSPPIHFGKIKYKRTHKASSFPICSHLVRWHSFISHSIDIVYRYGYGHCIYCINNCLYNDIPYYRLALSCTEMRFEWNTPGGETNMQQPSCYYFYRLKSIGLGRERTDDDDEKRYFIGVFSVCLASPVAFVSTTHSLREASMRCVTYNKSKQKEKYKYKYYTMIYAACRCWAWGTRACEQERRLQKGKRIQCSMCCALLWSNKSFDVAKCWINRIWFILMHGNTGGRATCDIVYTIYLVIAICGDAKLWPENTEQPPQHSSSTKCMQGNMK